MRIRGVISTFGEGGRNLYGQAFGGNHPHTILAQNGLEIVRKWVFPLSGRLEGIPRALRIGRKAWH